MSFNSIKAFSDVNKKYYKTREDIGFLPKGTIFYHDKDDKIYGSIADGCLKLCWSETGDCVGDHSQKICGGTVIFHTAFKDSNLFERVTTQDERNLQEIISELEDNLKKAKNQLNNIK